MAAQIALKRSQNNEERLAKELNKFFESLKQDVLKALDEYWNDYQMLKGHIDLICAPIHISHKDYYEIIKKYKLREYKLGQREAKRLVKLANKKAHNQANKSAQVMGVQAYIHREKDKNDLFGTLGTAEDIMLNKTFIASENTMNRVDNQINQIITDGYRSGKGINDVGAKINQRFDQLKSWESKRIARTEIHGSHNNAVMDMYQEMGVEYLQWNSVDDGRTRGSKPSDTANHIILDGEIIRFGDKFSNGLGYPGDTSGPIEEWIDCRCSNAPFVMPLGKMAPPGMEQFRESDLIDIETKPTEELLDNNVPNVAEPTAEQIQQNLTPQEQKQLQFIPKQIQESRDWLTRKPNATPKQVEAINTEINQKLTKMDGLKRKALGEIKSEPKQEDNLGKLKDLLKPTKTRAKPKVESAPKDIEAKPVEKPKTPSVKQPKRESEIDRINRMSSRELYESMTKTDQKKYDKAKASIENMRKSISDMSLFRKMTEKHFKTINELERKQKDKLTNKITGTKPKVKKEALTKTQQKELETFKKETPLNDFDKVFKWADKRCKGKIEYGYKFNVNTGELIGEEIRGSKGKVSMKDEGTNVGSLHIHTEDGMSFPSDTDIISYRCQKEQDHYILSNGEVWYVHAEENFGIMGKLTQIDVSRVYTKCIKEGNAEVEQLMKEGKVGLDEKSIQAACDKAIGDKLIEAFDTQKWRDKGLIVRRAYR